MLPSFLPLYHNNYGEFCNSSLKQGCYPYNCDYSGYYGYRGSGKQACSNSLSNSNYLLYKETDVILTISVECYSEVEDGCFIFHNKITTGKHRLYLDGGSNKINNNLNMQFYPYSFSGNKVGYENTRIPVMKFHVYGSICTHGDPNQTCVGYYIPIKE